MSLVDTGVWTSDRVVKSDIVVLSSSSGAGRE